jgi:hypothetical protein
MNEESLPNKSHCRLRVCFLSNLFQLEAHGYPGAQAVSTVCSRQCGVRPVCQRSSVDWSRMSTESSRKWTYHQFCLLLTRKGPRFHFLERIVSFTQRCSVNVRSKKADGRFDTLIKCSLTQWLSFNEGIWWCKLSREKPIHC